MGTHARFPFDLMIRERISSAVCRNSCIISIFFIEAAKGWSVNLMIPQALCSIQLCKMTRLKQRKDIIKVQR
jgi:hypothetical protein